MDHLGRHDFQDIYEPSDDSYLLMDTLKYELEYGGIPVDRALVCLEIGSGSGVVSACLRQLFHQRCDEIMINYVSDVNPKALQATLQTLQAASSDAHPVLEAVRCDLVSALPDLPCDVLIFNPPYVPTPDEEVGSHSIEAAWAGGKDGRRVVDRALPYMARLLQPASVGYLVTVDDNRPHELAQEFAKLGIRMVPLFRRRAHNESLTIQKLTPL